MSPGGSRAADSLRCKIGSPRLRQGYLPWMIVCEETSNARAQPYTHADNPHQIRDRYTMMGAQDVPAQIRAIFRRQGW
jgi:hypothetical protein